MAAFPLRMHVCAAGSMRLHGSFPQSVEREREGGREQVEGKERKEANEGKYQQVPNQ